MNIEAGVGTKTPIQDPTPTREQEPIIKFPNHSELTPPPTMRPPYFAQIRPDANIGQPWEKYLFHQMHIASWLKSRQSEIEQRVSAILGSDAVSPAKEFIGIAAREQYVLQIASDFLEFDAEVQYFTRRLMEAAQELRTDRLANPFDAQKGQGLVAGNYFQEDPEFAPELKALTRQCLNEVIIAESLDAAQAPDSDAQPKQLFCGMILNIDALIAERYFALFKGRYVSPFTKRLISHSALCWTKALTTEIALRLFANLPAESQQYVLDQLS